MKNITDLINESNSADYLDFEGILTDFLINTNINNWSYDELYNWCEEEEEISNKEYDEFEKWVSKNYKKLFNTSYSIKDKENYQKKLKKLQSKNKNNHPTFKFKDAFGHAIEYFDLVIFFDIDNETFNKGRIIDLDKKQSIGTIKLLDKSTNLPSDKVFKVKQFYILKSGLL